RAMSTIASRRDRFTASPRVVALLLLCSTLRPPPVSTLFPYTTLFRSPVARQPRSCARDRRLGRQRPRHGAEPATSPARRRTSHRSSRRPVADGEVSVGRDGTCAAAPSAVAGVCPAGDHHGRRLIQTSE